MALSAHSVEQADTYSSARTLYKKPSAYKKKNTFKSSDGSECASQVLAGKDVQIYLSLYFDATQMYECICLKCWVGVWALSQQGSTVADLVQETL